MEVSKQQEAIAMPVHDTDGYDLDDLKAFNVDATIPDRYRGTVADQRDMQTLGKKQVLRVRREDTNTSGGRCRAHGMLSA